MNGFLLLVRAPHPYVLILLRRANGNDEEASVSLGGLEGTSSDSTTSVGNSGSKVGGISGGAVGGNDEPAGLVAGIISSSIIIFSVTVSITVSSSWSIGSSSIISSPGVAFVDSTGSVSGRVSFDGTSLFCESPTRGADSPLSVWLKSGLSATIGASSVTSLLLFLTGSLESLFIFRVKLTLSISSAAFARFRCIRLRRSMRRIGSSESLSSSIGAINTSSLVFLSCDFFMGS